MFFNVSCLFVVDGQHSIAWFSAMFCKDANLVTWAFWDKELVNHQLQVLCFHGLRPMENQQSFRRRYILERLLFHSHVSFRGCNPHILTMYKWEKNVTDAYLQHGSFDLPDLTNHSGWVGGNGESMEARRN